MIKIASERLGLDGLIQRAQAKYEEYRDKYLKESSTINKHLLTISMESLNMALYKKMKFDDEQTVAELSPKDRVLLGDYSPIKSLEGGLWQDKGTFTGKVKYV